MATLTSSAVVVFYQVPQTASRRDDQNQEQKSGSNDGATSSRTSENDRIDEQQRQDVARGVNDDGIVLTGHALDHAHSGDSRAEAADDCDWSTGNEAQSADQIGKDPSAAEKLNNTQNNNNRVLVDDLHKRSPNHREQNKEGHTEDIDLLTVPSNQAAELSKEQKNSEQSGRTLGEDQTTQFSRCYVKVQKVDVESPTKCQQKLSPSKEQKNRSPTETIKPPTKPAKDPRPKTSDRKITKVISPFSENF